MIARRPLLLLAGIVAAALLAGRWVQQPDGEAPLAIDPGSEATTASASTDAPLAPVTLADEPESAARVEAASPEPATAGSGEPAPTAGPPATVLLRTALWTGALPGTPVGGLAVECSSETFPPGMWLELGRTDERGRLEVALPEPGSYRFRIDEVNTSVPEGLLPPGDLAETPLPHAPGIALPSVDLAAGERGEVTLWLMEARSLRGRVVDASGAPAHGARVALTGLDSCLRRGERTRRASLDERGAFVFEGLYPLEYELHQSGWSVGGTTPPTWVGEHIQPGDEFGARPGLYVDLRERSLAGVELSVAPGDFAISGRLVDDEGRPVEGRRIRAHSTHLANGAPNARDHLAAYERTGFLASARTDALGRFQLEGILRRPMMLVVEPTEVPRLDRGTWAFGERTTLFAFDPSTDPEDSFDIGDVAVPTVELYRASGTVELDASHPGAAGIARGDLILDLHYSPDEDLRALTPSTQPRREFDPNTGEFQYVCLTPRNQATLWLYPSGQGGRGKTIQLYPKAGIVESGLVLTYP